MTEQPTQRVDFLTQPVVCWIQVMDRGGVNDNSVWSFTGTDGGLTVSSGSFTAGQANLILPFRDNPANGSTSFLGNGPSGDGGCNNCYFGPLAALDTPSVIVSAAPEPGAGGLMLAGVGAIVCFLRRRSSSI